MPASSTMAAIKNGGPFSHFRRTQSLRFPRATTTGSPLGNHHHPAISSPSSCGVQSANGSGSLSRKGSRNFRSKSSRHRHGKKSKKNLF